MPVKRHMKKGVFSQRSIRDAAATKAYGTLLTPCGKSVLHESQRPV
jgi:hypothetical protein